MVKLVVEPRTGDGQLAGDQVRRQHQHWCMRVLLTVLRDAPELRQNAFPWEASTHGGSNPSQGGGISLA